MNLQLFLCATALIYFVICFIPLIMRINPLLGKDVEGNNIDDAIRSTALKYSLIVSLSMSLPMAFELLLRVVVDQNYKSASAAVGHNLAVLLSLIIPDAVALFYVIPNQDTGMMSVVLKARFLLITWFFLSFMNRRVNSGWSPRLSAALHVTLCISSLPPFYKVYCAPAIAFPLEIVIGYLVPMFGLYITATLCYRWIKYVIKETRNKELSTDLYLDNIYVCAYIITFVMLGILRISYPNYAEWYQYDATFLATITLTSTVFYTIIVVFERRLIHRDSILLQASFLYPY